MRVTFWNGKPLAEQSTTILILKAGEIVTYGSGKGKDKKIRPAFYIRSLHAFDDEPELVDAAHLKQNCKPAAAATSSDNTAQNDFDESSQIEQFMKKVHSTRFEF